MERRKRGRRGGGGGGREGEAGEARRILGGDGVEGGEGDEGSRGGDSGCFGRPGLCSQVKGTAPAIRSGSLLNSALSFHTLLFASPPASASLLTDSNGAL